MNALENQSNTSQAIFMQMLQIQLQILAFKVLKNWF